MSYWITNFSHSFANADSYYYLAFIVDVLVVAFVLYKIFVFLERTRAQSLFFFVVIIFIAKFSTQLFGLETLHWMITNVFTYLAFAIVIMLQPELRHLITEISDSFQNLFQKNPLASKKIINVVKNMSAAKIGSILVFLKKIRPDHIIDQGVKIDAVISEELIETIFFKNSPLHDGAVILEGSRILAASCYLPLSRSRGLKKTQGARFRAALGISEETDAIVILTSEETKKVFIFHNGKVENPHINELEQSLENYMPNMR